MLFQKTRNFKLFQVFRFSYDEYANLKRLRKVNWVVKDIRENILAINGGTSMTLFFVVKRGLKCSYETVEENTTFFKGKMKFSQQIRFNHSHKERSFLLFSTKLQTNQ